MPKLATLKASLDFLLLGRLEWLLWLLHLVLLDRLTKVLVLSTKGLMNHHFTKLLIALSVLLPTSNNLALSTLSFLFSFKRLVSSIDMSLQREGQGMSSKSWHEVEASTFA